MGLSAKGCVVFGVAALAVVAMIHFDTKISGLTEELRKQPLAITQECTTQILGANPTESSSWNEQATRLESVLACARAASSALAVQSATPAPAPAP